LLLPNSPYYPIIWLACLHIQIIPAFINTSITGKSLSSCVSISDAKILLFDIEYEGNVQTVVEQLGDVKLLRWTDRFNTKDLEKEVKIPDVEHVDEKTWEGFSDEPYPHEARANVTMDSSCCLLYTR
jgi:acyl-CoA synthetase (AMP-forming)/AMP-acid ligase II